MEFWPERRRKLLMSMSIAQLTLGILYAILEAVSAGLYIAYRMDFSPLPLLVIGGGLLGYGAVKRGSLGLLSLTVGISAYCASHSLRDIYVFVYHAASGGAVPADGPSLVSFTGGTLAMHFAVAVLALIELVIAVGLVYLASAAVAGSVHLLINRIKLAGLLTVLKALSATQVN